MPVSKEQKELFKETIKPYKSKTEELKKEINADKLAAKKNPNLKAYLAIRIGITSIAYANTSIKSSNLSEKIQGARNNSYLNQARIEISNCISDLNRIFGEHIGDSLTENQKILEKVSELTPEHKLCFFKELVNVVRDIKNSLGDKSKWRWSFPDMHYHLTVFSKNFFDFKLFQSTKDPNDENYQPLKEYLNLLMEEARHTAQELRSRHELSTHAIGEFYKIRSIFEMQKIVYTMCGNKIEVDKIQTSLDNVSGQIEDLVAKKEKK